MSHPAKWIESDHRVEWEHGSGVDSELVTLNVRSLTDLEVDENSREVSAPIADLLNWKVVRFGNQVKQGIRGWWVAGIDPLNFMPMEWGRFKPDVPFLDHKKGSAQRYASPTGVPSRATFLEVPDRLWQLVVDRAGIPKSGDCFWRWVLECNVPIVLCEGEKKAGCLLSLGYAAIALPGFRSAARSRDRSGAALIHPTLIPDIKAFATPARQISICFDYEIRQKTAKEIYLETKKLCRLLTIAECSARVITLPGPEKGVDDFVAAKGAEAFNKLYEQALPLSQWQTFRYSQLTYGTNESLNQRFLGSLNLPSDRRLFGIKSPKGTGKTEALKEIVAGAMERGQRVLLLTHRVQLGQAICDRVGLNYVTELRGSDEGALFGYGLCIDSLHPESQAQFNAEDWQDAIVILDEAEQVIWHLLNAKTEVSTHRLVILDQLRQLFLNTLASDRGQVILLDADLTDVAIKFVLRLSDGEAWVNPWIIVNQYDAREKRICYSFDDSKPRAWYTELNRLVDDDKKLFVVTQSQKKKSTYSAHNMAKDIGRRHPTKRILVIDSETISDPNHPAYCCTSKLNDVLTRYDLVFVTPTIGTGVSIDLRGYFDAVFGCFWGVDSADSARQNLARIRDDIPRYVWAAGYGIGRIGNGATSKFGLRESQSKLAKAAIARLAAWWEDDGGYQTNDAALQTWAEMACRVNGQMIGYRDAVSRGLEKEGYEVRRHEVIPDPELSDSLSETKDSEYRLDSENEVATPLIDDTGGEKLKGKRSKTSEERLQLRKWKRHKKYGLEVDIDLIVRDDDDWFPQIQLYYYLFIGRRFLEQRDAKALHSVAHANQVWYPSLNRSQVGVRVALFEFLNIQMLIDEEREFKNSDGDMKDLLEKAIANRQVLKDLGVTVGENDSAIAISNKLLKKIGMKLTFCHKEGKRGANERVYRMEALADRRFEVFEHWLKRDELLTQNQSAVGAVLNSSSLRGAA
jgi:hypothetical protein